MHTPDAFAYGSSKAACAFFSASVAKDVDRYRTRVNCVSPGVTMTPMLSQFLPSGQQPRELDKQFSLDVIATEDVARTVVWLLSEESAPVFGANVNVGAEVA